MTATTSPGPAGSTVERPTSVDEAVKVLRDSRGSVLFRGAGTKMSWAGRPADPDLVLETGGLDRLLDHNPADMTASAQAGMPLRALQDRLAEAGQWLALDPPTEPALAEAALHDHALVGRALLVSPHTGLVRPVGPRGLTVERVLDRRVGEPVVGVELDPRRAAELDLAASEVVPDREGVDLGTGARLALLRLPLVDAQAPVDDDRVPLLHAGHHVGRERVERHDVEEVGAPVDEGPLLGVPPPGGRRDAQARERPAHLRRPADRVADDVAHDGHEALVHVMFLHPVPM